jgi:23S rRNA (cytosine1962-C5)-methyltransferase
VGGAIRAVEMDASARALDLSRLTRRLNGLPASEEDFVKADVPEELRRRVAAGETWDLIIVDPPGFVKKQADLQRGLRGYQDVNRLAMRLLAPGGLLLSCSCSGLVSPELLQKVLFSASVEAGVSLRLLERRGAGIDHPVALDCPEGEYLKAFLLHRL